MHRALHLGIGLRVGLLLSAAVLGAAGTAAPAGEFPSALAALDRAGASGQTTAERLEDEYLNLLSQALSREQVGLVYAHVGLMYVQAGARYCDATEAYCREALRYPLPVVLAARLHMEISNAVGYRYVLWPDKRAYIARYMNAEAALEALAFMVASGAPRVPAPAPTMVMPDIVGPHADEAVRHQLSANAAAQEKSDALKELCQYRSQLVDRLAYMYSKPPQTADELHALALDALSRYPEVVQEIMDRLATKLGQGAKPLPK